MSKFLNIEVRTLRMLFIALLGIAFVLICSVGTEGSKSTSPTEPMFDKSNVSAVHSAGLKLTPKLGMLPKLDTDLERLPVNFSKQPIPWWPAILFGLAFSCGWLLRSNLRKAALLSGTTASVTEAENQASAVQELEQNALISSPDLAAQNSSEQTQASVNLTQDFPWDDSLIDDYSKLSDVERIEALEKQNKTRASIIEALELMLVENREKWLHRDQTEARQDQRIRKLTEDLQALRKLQ